MRRPCRLDSVTPSAARRTDCYARTVRQNDRENEDSCKNLSSAWRVVLSRLSASACQGPFPQPLHVAHRWDTEEAFVLPIEVGGVAIPHAIGCTGRVEVSAQHQTPGLLQPQPLLELQGAHRRDGLEVVVEHRDAHAQLARHLLDAQWLVEIFTESLDRSGDGGGVAPQDRQVTEPSTLLSSQKPVDNFPRDQRQEDRRFVRGIQEPGDAHHGVQQVPIHRADGYRPHIRMISQRGVTDLNEDLTDEGGSEVQAQTEEWPLLRGFQDLANVGQIDRHEQIVEGVIPVAALAQQELLAALGNHAQGWLDHAVNLLQREGVAVQVQPWERLDGPILAYGPHNPLHQFLAIGLHPLGLAFCLLMVYHIHRNLFSCFSIAYLEDAQNQTIICDNYSTIRCEGTSIITIRQRTFFSAFTGKLAFSSREDPAVREHETRQIDSMKTGRHALLGLQPTHSRRFYD